MSARKKATISINDAIYEKIHNDEMAAIFSATYYENNQDLLKEQVNQTYQEIDRRMDEYSKVISNFYDEVAVIEQEAASTIYQSQLEMTERLNQIEIDITNFSTQWMNRELDQIDKTIDTIQLSLSERIDQLQQQLLTDKVTDTNHNEEAFHLLETVRSLYTFVINHYDVDRFILPQQMNKIVLTISQIETLNKKGMYQAAFQKSLETYQELSSLRVKLEQAQSRWRILKAKTLNYAMSLYNLGKNLRFIQPVDLDWNPITDAKPIPLNFWTNGDYQSWLDRMRAILFQIKMDKPKLSEEDLLVYLNEKLPDLENEINRMVFQARRKVLDSQIRVNIAAVTIHALVQLGYRKTSASYDSQDERKGFTARLINREGNEISVQVEPEEDTSKTNLQLITMNQTPYTQYENQRRNYEILKSLKNYGLKVENIEVIPENKNSSQDSLKIPSIIHMTSYN